MVTTAMKLKDAYSLEKNYDQSRQHIKKQRHYFANKDPYSQSYDFFQESYMDVRIGLKAERQRIDTFEQLCWRRFLSSLHCVSYKLSLTKSVANN